LALHCLHKLGGDKGEHRPWPAPGPRRWRILRQKNTPVTEARAEAALGQLQRLSPRTMQP
jgi:hypothetical protein